MYSSSINSTGQAILVERAVTLHQPHYNSPDENTYSGIRTLHVRCPHLLHLLRPKTAQQLLHILDHNTDRGGKSGTRQIVHKTAGGYRMRACSSPKCRTHRLLYLIELHKPSGEGGTLPRVTGATTARPDVVIGRTPRTSTPTRAMKTAPEQTERRKCGKAVQLAAAPSPTRRAPSHYGVGHVRKKQQRMSGTGVLHPIRKKKRPEPVCQRMFRAY